MISFDTFWCAKHGTRRNTDEKKYREVTEADLIFRNQVRKRFAGGRFEGMYRAWKNGHISESHIRYNFRINNRKYTVDFALFYSRQVPKLILTRCHDDVNTNDANDRVVRRAYGSLRRQNSPAVGTPTHEAGALPFNVVGHFD